jgi:hypothetical protein
MELVKLTLANVRYRDRSYRSLVVPCILLVLETVVGLIYALSSPPSDFVLFFIAIQSILLLLAGCIAIMVHVPMPLSAVLVVFFFFFSLSVFVAFNIWLLSCILLFLVSWGMILIAVFDAGKQSKATLQAFRELERRNVDTLPFFCKSELFEVFLQTEMGQQYVSSNAELKALLYRHVVGRHKQLIIPCFFNQYVGDMYIYIDGEAHVEYQNMVGISGVVEVDLIVSEGGSAALRHKSHKWLILKGESVEFLEADRSNLMDFLLCCRYPRRKLRFRTKGVSRRLVLYMPEYTPGLSRMERYMKRNCARVFLRDYDGGAVAD